ncbi:MAG: hypothetical protein ACKO4S_17985 [Snowella sp.]
MMYCVPTVNKTRGRRSPLYRLKNGLGKRSSRKNQLKPIVLIF